MGDPNFSSERRDGLEEDVRYPRATRRRMAIARALGAAGVLGTLALAAAAFAPRMARGLWFAPTVPANSVAPIPVRQLNVPPPVPLASVAESPPAATASAPEPSAAPAPSTSESPPAPQVTATATERARPASVPRRARQEPALTPRGIERRQQRYELWLRQQGLERVH